MEANPLPQYCRFMRFSHKDEDLTEVAFRQHADIIGEDFIYSVDLSGNPRLSDNTLAMFMANLLDRHELLANSIFDRFQRTGRKPLEIIDLSKTGCGQETFKQLALLLKSNEFLRTLRLRDLRITPGDAVIGGMIESLRRVIPFSNLARLDLSGNRISVGVSSLLDSLEDCTTLTDLSLSQCGLTAENGESIAKALPSIRNLASLDLSGNPLLDYSRFTAQARVEEQAGSTLKSPPIRKLTARSLTREQVPALCEWIGTSPSRSVSLQFLDLTDSNLKAVDTSGLCGMLTACHGLRSLSLRRCGISRDVFTAVLKSLRRADAPQRYKPYEHLDFSENVDIGEVPHDDHQTSNTNDDDEDNTATCCYESHDLGSDFRTIISQAVTVSLRHCGLRDDDLFSIFTALRKPPQPGEPFLRRLDISYNYAGNCGLGEAIASFLSCAHAKELFFLNVASNSLPDFDVTSIIMALKDIQSSENPIRVLPDLRLVEVVDTSGSGYHYGDASSSIGSTSTHPLSHSAPKPKSQPPSLAPGEETLASKLEENTINSKKRQQQQLCKKNAITLEQVTDLNQLFETIRYRASNTAMVDASNAESRTLLRGSPSVRGSQQGRQYGHVQAQQLLRHQQQHLHLQHNTGSTALRHNQQQHHDPGSESGGGWSAQGPSAPYGQRGGRSRGGVNAGGGGGRGARGGGGGGTTHHHHHHHHHNQFAAFHQPNLGGAPPGHHHHEAPAHTEGALSNHPHMAYGRGGGGGSSHHHHQHHFHQHQHHHAQAAHVPFSAYSNHGPPPDEHDD